MAEREQSVPVGIDLGTTYSVLACVDQQGRPTTVRNDEGDATTPSVVLFDRSGVVVGREAVKAAAFEPQRVAVCAKRDMGRTSFRKAIVGHELPPEVIQALVLAKLKTDAEVSLGPLHQAVITVPAFFNEPRRKATQDAGKLAGFEVLDIINEPTAAAIAYGVAQGYLSSQGQSRKIERFLVYDLGGGTFDATIMQIQGRHYRTLATLGDVYLGGVDWDDRIASFIGDRFLEEHGVDPREDEEALLRLRKEAEEAKRGLTAREEVTILFDMSGMRLRVMLTRAEFESLTADLLERTRFTITKLLRDAKLKWKDLTRVLLVGGSTRMPMIRAMLEEETGLTPDRSLSPDEAVAHGAAIYARILTQAADRERPSIEVTNVNSHDLGVMGYDPKTGLKRRRVMIRRNTALPATGASNFVTKSTGQRDVAVNVVEGGDDSGRGATKIGKCVVTDLPPELPARSLVEVRFRYATNGRLEVTAHVPSVERQATLTVERSAGLTDAMLQGWKRRIAAGLQLQEKPANSVQPPRQSPPPPQRPMRPIPVRVEDEQEELEEIEELEELEAVEDVPTNRPRRRSSEPRADTALERFLDDLP